MYNMYRTLPVPCTRCTWCQYQYHLCAPDVHTPPPHALALLLLQGQLIYVKYVFDELVSRGAAWSLSELSRLPDGMDSMYSYVLAEVEKALENDGRRDLLDLLMTQVCT